MGTILPARPAATRVQSTSRIEALLLVVVAAVAILLRLVDLADLPRGLLVDEAYNGVDALRIIGGERPFFLPANFGREALFIYLQAVSVRLFGQNELALRLPAAAFSLGTIVVAYLLVRRMFGARVALLTSAWYAVSFWDVALSRLGLRTISLPFFACASLYCFWRGIGIRRGDEETSAGRTKPVVTWFALSGLFLGASLYTYTAARFLPFVPLGFVGYLLLVKPKKARAVLGPFVLLGVVALLVFLPEGAYFLRHPDMFLYRAQAVSVVLTPGAASDRWRTLLDAVARNLGIFGIAGDPDWARNLPGRPILDPISFGFALLGLARLLRHPRRPDRAFLLIWLGVMLLPSLLTTKEVPNNLRVTGLIPLPFLLPALGADAAWRAWPKRSPLLATAPWAALAAALLLGAAGTYRDYFLTWSRNEAVTSTFNADRWTAIEAARQVQVGGGAGVYVAAGDADEPLQDFALAGQGDASGLRLFNGTRSAIFPPSATPTIYVLASRDAGILPILRAADPSVTVEPGPLAPDGQPTLLARLTPAWSRLSAPLSVPARLGSELRLSGFDVERDAVAGRTIRVRWYWQLIAPVSRELTFFQQLYDESDHRVGQVDDRAFAPNYWPPGTSGVSTFDVPVPSTAVTGAYSLVVGAYDRATLDRLPVVDGQGHQAGSQLTLGPFKVHGRPPPPPLITIPRSVRFDDGVALAGYDVQPRAVHPGDALTVTLDWAPWARPSRDYTVFVHLLDGRGKLIAQADAPPRAGRYPTSAWDGGDVIADPHALTIPPDAAPGPYRIEIGLYVPETGARLPVRTGGRVDSADLDLSNLPKQQMGIDDQSQ